MDMLIVLGKVTFCSLVGSIVGCIIGATAGRYLVKAVEYYSTNHSKTRGATPSI